eukprot:m.255389 g.255389  ORF g.255389 m.255389 type:complete len:50 (+) comp19471_c0_seq1:45-194(+)
MLLLFNLIFSSKHVKQNKKEKGFVAVYKWSDSTQPNRQHPEIFFDKPGN